MRTEAPDSINLWIDHIKTKDREQAVQPEKVDFSSWLHCLSAVTLFKF